MGQQGSGEVGGESGQDSSLWRKEFTGAFF